MKFQTKHSDEYESKPNSTLKEDAIKAICLLLVFIAVAMSKEQKKVQQQRELASIVSINQ